jgi:hypothetical protein
VRWSNAAQCCSRIKDDTGCAEVMVSCARMRAPARVQPLLRRTLLPARPCCTQVPRPSCTFFLVFVVVAAVKNHVVDADPSPAAVGTLRSCRAVPCSMLCGCTVRGHRRAKGSARPCAPPPASHSPLPPPPPPSFLCLILPICRPVLQGTQRQRWLRCGLVRWFCVGGACICLMGAVTHVWSTCVRV